MLGKRWSFSLCRFDDDPPADPPATDPPAADPPADPPAVKTPEELASEVEKWKKLSRQNEATAKANADKAKQWDDAQTANQTELEREKARAEAAEQRAEARTKTAVRSEVRSLADDFHDRDDAIVQLAAQDGGLERFVNADTGEIDTEAIKTALAGVLDSKKHLKKSAGAPQDPSLGPRGGGQPTNFATVDKAAFDAELGKHGLRPRSR